MKEEKGLAKFVSKVKDFFHSIKEGFISFGTNFKNGDKITKLSYFIMGYGCLARKQVGRGLLFLGTQLAFILFMILKGFYYLSMLPTLGTKLQDRVYNEELQIYQYIQGDNSMLLLLFGVVTVVLIILFVCLYVWNTRIAYHNQCLVAEGRTLPTFKQDIKALGNENFHVTVLSLPVLLTFCFTVLPLIFMILMAFTNFDMNHQPPGNLFTWVGLENFSQVFIKNPLWQTTFIQLLGWPLVWAFFATFLNYIFGMLLAIIINKKGVKFKKMWRTIFIITIAVPQFVSLMLMSKMLADQGAINNLLVYVLKWIPDAERIKFLTDANLARVVVIVVNLWVGIPYSMLITSGILMNIPQDLYEASRIDGATPFIQFIHITLHYMLHVTTPYLITQFVGNINNFNVIYLLTAGDPKSLDLFQAGKTDLLVTWLYKLTVNEQNYALASTIGIIIFLLMATISLITYNKSNAVQEEDTFA